MNNNHVLEITKNVRWIGALDFDIVTFDVVMETEYGTTYNSYFIDAGKKTVIDTVKEKFRDEYMSKLKSLTDPSEIEYIVALHTEPDHSGNIRNLLDIAPKATVVASGNAIRYLKDMIGPDFPHIVIKDGQTLDLGDKTLRFIGASNLHWPDTMYSYLEEEKLLFTCDSFGCHFCHEDMFDDQVGDFDDAFTYYFNVILKPFSKHMLRAIGKIRPLEISAICPGHGPILRSDWKKYVDLSEKYSLEALQLRQKHRVYIPYVSAYHKTGVLAGKIAEGLRRCGGIEVDLQDIETVPLGELDERIARASAIIVGSPTINQNILLPVYKLFAVISPLRDHGKLAGAFGSYGWSGENRKMLESNLINLKLNYFGEGIFVKFTPSQQEIEKCIEYGKAFGETLLASELLSDTDA